MRRIVAQLTIAFDTSHQPVMSFMTERALVAFDGSSMRCQIID
jgi:hypothetical protein